MSGSGVIVVTGAAGFIGSHVCAALRASGRQVAGVDNFDPFYPRARKEAALRRWREDARPGEDFAELDLAEPGAFVAFLDRFGSGGVDGVIHLAAKAGVRPSLEDPAGYARANVVATSEVLEASRRAGAQRVVFASSSSVYGNHPDAPFAETHDVERPISPYAATKRAGELICWTHHHLTGMPVAALRFFTVYGPGQRPDLAIALFLERVSRGQRLTMYGDGSMSRDFTYVGDVVSGVLASYERIDAHGYRIWNLGSDAPVRLDAMIETVGRVVGREAVVERAAMQAGDVDRTWADLTRSRAELGYAPMTSLEAGMRRQWEAERSLAGV